MYKKLRYLNPSYFLFYWQNITLDLDDENMKSDYLRSVYRIKRIRYFGDKKI
jgi:hypothetical protein